MSIKIAVDAHTHTNCSDHAFGTVWENLRVAAQRGLELVCMTNHTPPMPDCAHIWHFTTMHELPDYIEGVRLLKGCESNVLNIKGEISLDVEHLEKAEVVVASIHQPCYDDRDLEDHTEAWLGVIKNPYVNIIGHSGDPRCPYDIDKVVRAARDAGKCIEINNHSYSVRRRSAENCRRIAEKCKEVGCGIVVSSDAHTPFDVGNVSNALNMLEEIGFPEELIMNTTAEKFVGFLNASGKNIRL